MREVNEVDCSSNGCKPLARTHAPLHDAPGQVYTSKLSYNSHSRRRNKMRSRHHYLATRSQQIQLQQKSCELATGGLNP